MMQHGRGGHGARRRESLEDPITQDDTLSEDDNAAPEMQSEPEEKQEDPLELALDDLRGRVLAALEDIKLHPGVRSSSFQSIHEELATLLKPVLEVAAHTGPSVARTYYPAGEQGIETSCEEVFTELLDDLALPAIKEIAQSDTIPAKRAGALEFFHNLWKECAKAGSWLDKTTTGPNAGPYGPGGGSGGGTSIARHVQKRRHVKRMERESLLLRYWVQSSIACLVPGVFTSDASEGAVASRGVIAALASFRPSLKHIAQRIQDADDRGAARLYGPVMQMVEGVLKKLFLGEATNDALRSACIKFLEIVVLCCSARAQLGKASASRRRGHHAQTEDFALEDLPAGHPIITREALESVGEYAFTTLRGLVLMGGQVTIDVNVLSDMMLGTSQAASPSAQVVSILKPAALAFLDVESTLGENLTLDRSNLELDFELSQKSYALSINAVSMLAIHRPVFYKEAAICLARRTYDPPVYKEGSSALQKSAVLAICAQLRASCLTLLRNTLSFTTSGDEVLIKALEKWDMGAQAQKARAVAKKNAHLDTAGRAARNRAAMFYEWDDSDDKQRKRQRETSEDLAKMRAVKAARGLGHGIQLSSNMVDSVELVLLNLTHLPSSRPAPTGKSRNFPVDLDYVVDAVMSNGASLSRDDGLWYDRDGGTAWSVDLPRYELESSVLDAAMMKKTTKEPKKSQKLFQDQCRTAASQAFGRVVATASQTRNASTKDFGNKIASRLAWTLGNVAPPQDLEPCLQMAQESVSSLSKQIEAANGSTDEVKEFVEKYPLVSSCLTLDVTSSAATAAANATVPMSSFVLNEAYMQDCIPAADEKEKVKDDKENATKYKSSLDIFAASVVHAGERSNEKPADEDRKRVASLAAASLSHHLGILPLVTPSSLEIVSNLTDIEEIAKKAAEAARKSSQQTIAASSAAHAIKVAGEQRAKRALIALRDASFQRSAPESRNSAVHCVVAIASGRYPATPTIVDQALKLAMNILFPRSPAMADAVVAATIRELEHAAEYAIANYDKIQEANKNDPIRLNPHQHYKKHAIMATSEEEKVAMDHVKSAALLFMAACLQRPELIQTLMQVSCRDKADVLLKGVKASMPRFVAGMAKKHGAAAMALKVSEMATEKEIPMVLAFLDNLVQRTDKNLPPQNLIDACLEIQESRLDSEGKKDARFVIPVLTGMKRADIVKMFPQFILSGDDTFKAALTKMGERLARQALLYREETDPETPTLCGMTLCEQVVFIHHVAFGKDTGLTQKRVLGAIDNCLNDVQVYTDDVVKAALDYMSGTALSTGEELPLAFMRTVYRICTTRESMRPWISHKLLPRLVECQVYNNSKYFEIWMRCARMLETSGDAGVGVAELFQSLPPEQLEKYRAKFEK